MCDCLVALPKATGGAFSLFAKNSDRPANEPQDVRWHRPRFDRSPFQATHIRIDPHPSDTFGHLSIQPRWMWGVEGGVNEAGVAMGNERITTTLDPRLLPNALTGMDLVRLALERSASATEAVEVVIDLLGRYGQGGSGEADRHVPYWSSFLVADGTRAYQLETSGRAYEVMELEVSGAISNRTTLPAFDAEHRHPRQPVDTLINPRLLCSAATLAVEPVNVDSVMKWQRNHDAHPEAPGWSVCMHVADKGFGQRTTAAFIAELPTGERKARERPRMWVTLGSPCVSVSVPLRVGEEPFGIAPRWERFARLTAEHRHAMDELQVWLQAELPSPDEAWRGVTSVLDRLGV